MSKENSNNPFGSSNNPFKGGNNPFVSSNNPFKSSTNNPFESTNNPFGDSKPFLSGFDTSIKKVEDDENELLGVVSSLLNGFVEGFTTISVGDEPEGDWEGIAHSIGHLAGFIGIIPGFGMLGSLVSRNLVKAVGFGLKISKAKSVAGSTLQFAKAIKPVGNFKSVPMWFADKIMEQATKMLPSSASTAAKELLLKTGIPAKALPGIAKVAHEAAHLGLASAASSREQGLEGMMDALVGGAFAGTFFGTAGQLMPGKIGTEMAFSSKVKSLFIDKKSNTLDLDYQGLGRVLANSIFMGGNTALSGGSAPSIIYESLLGGYFGVVGVDSHTKSVIEFYGKAHESQNGRTKSKTEFDVLLFNLPSQNNPGNLDLVPPLVKEAYEKLTPRAKEILSHDLETKSLRLYSITDQELKNLKLSGTAIEIKKTVYRAIQEKFDELTEQLRKKEITSEEFNAQRETLMEKIYSYELRDEIERVRAKEGAEIEAEFKKSNQKYTQEDIETILLEKASHRMAQKAYIEQQIRSDLEDSLEQQKKNEVAFSAEPYTAAYLNLTKTLEELGNISQVLPSVPYEIERSMGVDDIGEKIKLQTKAAEVLIESGKNNLTVGETLKALKKAGLEIKENSGLERAVLQAIYYSKLKPFNQVVFNIGKIVDGVYVDERWVGDAGGVDKNGNNITLYKYLHPLTHLVQKFYPEFKVTNLTGIRTVKEEIPLYNYKNTMEEGGGTFHPLQITLELYEKGYNIFSGVKDSDTVILTSFVEGARSLEEVAETERTIIEYLNANGGEEEAIEFVRHSTASGDMWARRYEEVHPKATAEEKLKVRAIARQSYINNLLIFSALDGKSLVDFISTEKMAFKDVPSAVKRMSLLNNGFSRVNPDDVMTKTLRTMLLESTNSNGLVEDGFPNVVEVTNKFIGDLEREHNDLYVRLLKELGIKADLVEGPDDGSGLAQHTREGESKPLLLKDLSMQRVKEEFALIKALLPDDVEVFIDYNLTDGNGVKIKGSAELGTLAITINPSIADLTTIPHEIAHIALYLADPIQSNLLLRRAGWDGVGEITDYDSNKSLLNAHETIAEDYELYLGDRAKFDSKYSKEEQETLGGFFEKLRLIFKNIAAWFKNKGITPEHDFYQDLSKGKFRKRKGHKKSVSDKDDYPLFQRSKDSGKVGVGHVNHSGGADGADRVWGEIGEEYGVKSNHYFKHIFVSPGGNTKITPEQYKEGLVEAKKAAKELGRRWSTKSVIQGLLSRNWQQAKNADSVVAISVIEDNGVLVKGGTGYAVEMAKTRRIPINIFDQERKKWFSWDYKSNEFVKSGIPKLTKNFAGIGTKEINAAGKEAIRNVYENTFGLPTTEASKGPSINVYSSDKTKWAKLSNFNTGPVTYNGKKFASVEHAYQWSKAKEFGDRKTMAAIEKAKTGYDAQRLGRATKGFKAEVWGDGRSDLVLQEVMEEYYKQNAEAKELLLSTGDATLTHNKPSGHEADKRFASILMGIRDRIKREPVIKRTSRDSKRPLVFFRANGTVAIQKGITSDEAIDYFIDDLEASMGDEDRSIIKMRMNGDEAAWQNTVDTITESLRGATEEELEKFVLKLALRRKERARQKALPNGELKESLANGDMTDIENLVESINLNPQGEAKGIEEVEEPKGKDYTHIVNKFQKVLNQERKPKGFQEVVNQILEAKGYTALKSNKTIDEANHIGRNQGTVQDIIDIDGFLKSIADPTQLDGPIFMRDDIYDEMVKATGWESQSGAQKGTLVTNKIGLILGKYAIHKADKIMSDSMRKNNVEVLGLTTSFKKSGDLVASKWHYNKATQEYIFENPEGATVPLSVDDYTFTYGGEHTRSQIGNQNIPSQFMSSLWPDVHTNTIRFLNDLSYSSINGDEETNKLALKLQTEPNAHNVDGIDVDKISLNTILKIINEGKETPLYKKIVAKILKLDGEGEYAREALFDEEVAIRKAIGESKSAAEQIINLWGITTTTMHFKPVARHFNNMLKYYVLNRGTRPIWGDSASVVLRPTAPGDIEYSMPGYMQVGRAVGDMKVNYQGKSITIKEAVEIRNEKISKGEDLKEIEASLTLITERVPTDHVSGIRPIVVSRVLEVDGAIAALHSNDMKLLGGADTDMDKAFIFLNLPKEVVAELESTKDSFTKYYDKSVADKISKEAKKGKFRPDYTKALITPKEAADGREYYRLTMDAKDSDLFSSKSIYDKHTLASADLTGEYDSKVKSFRVNEQDLLEPIPEELDKLDEVERTRLLGIAKFINYGANLKVSKWGVFSGMTNVDINKDSHAGKELVSPIIGTSKKLEGIIHHLYSSKKPMIIIPELRFLRETGIDESDTVVVSVDEENFKEVNDKFIGSKSIKNFKELKRSKMFSTPITYNDKTIILIDKADLAKLENHFENDDAGSLGADLTILLARVKNQLADTRGNKISFYGEKRSEITKSLKVLILKNEEHLKRGFAKTYLKGAEIVRRMTYDRLDVEQFRFAKRVGGNKAVDASEGHSLVDANEAMEILTSSLFGGKLSYKALQETKLFKSLSSFTRIAGMLGQPNTERVDLGGYDRTGKNATLKQILNEIQSLAVNSDLVKMEDPFFKAIINLADLEHNPTPYSFIGTDLDVVNKWILSEIREIEDAGALLGRNATGGNSDNPFGFALLTDMLHHPKTQQIKASGDSEATSSYLDELMSQDLSVATSIRLLLTTAPEKYDLDVINSIHEFAIKIKQLIAHGLKQKEFSRKDHKEPYDVKVDILEANKLIMQQKSEGYLPAKYHDYLDAVLLSSISSVKTNYKTLTERVKKEVGVKKQAALAEVAAKFEKKKNPTEEKHLIERANKEAEIDEEYARMEETLLAKKKEEFYGTNFNDVMFSLTTVSDKMKMEYGKALQHIVRGTKGDVEEFKMLVKKQYVDGSYVTPTIEYKDKDKLISNFSLIVGSKLESHVEGLDYQTKTIIEKANANLLAYLQRNPDQIQEIEQLYDGYQLGLLEGGVINSIENATPEEYLKFTEMLSFHEMNTGKPVRISSWDWFKNIGRVAAKVKPFEKLVPFKDKALVYDPNDKNKSMKWKEVIVMRSAFEDVHDIYKKIQTIKNAADNNRAALFKDRIMYKLVTTLDELNPGLGGKLFSFIAAEIEKDLGNYSQKFIEETGVSGRKTDIYSNNFEAIRPEYEQLLSSETKYRIVALNGKELTIKEMTSMIKKDLAEWRSEMQSKHLSDDIAVERYLRLYGDPDDPLLSPHGFIRVSALLRALKRDFLANKNIYLSHSLLRRITHREMLGNLKVNVQWIIDKTAKSQGLVLPGDPGDTGYESLREYNKFVLKSFKGELKHLYSEHINELFKYHGKTISTMSEEMQDAELFRMTNSSRNHNDFMIYKSSAELIPEYLKDRYFPHNDYDYDTLLSSKKEELQRHLEQDGDDRDKTNGLIDQILKIKTSAAEDETGSSEKSQKALEEIAEITEEKEVTHFQATFGADSFRDRINPLPGWKNSLASLEKYETQSNSVYYDFLANRISRETIESREADNFLGEESKSWAKFLHLYSRSQVGGGSLIPDAWLKDPKMKLKNNPFMLLTDSFWVNRILKSDKKMGKRFLKDFPDMTEEDYKKLISNEETKGILTRYIRNRIQNQIAHYSRLEAKFEMLTLLSTPKVFINNMFSGTQNTIVNTGFKNWKEAHDLPYLRSILGEGINSIEDVYRFAEKMGSTEAMFSVELGLRTGTVNRKMAESLEEITKSIKENGFDKGKIAKIIEDSGLSEITLNAAGYFMRRSEMKLRARAWVSHYLNAYETLTTNGYRMEPDHPWLIKMANKGVEATQFLYSNSERAAFSRTHLGKIVSRFQLWAWNSIKFRRDIHSAAHNAGYQEGSAEFERLKRLAVLDLLVFALAKVFAGSIFDNTLAPPLSYLQDTAEFMFGDDKKKEKAFGGGFAYPFNATGIITPPAMRTIHTAVRLLSTGDLDRAANDMISFIPFGRSMKSFYRIYENVPYGLESLTGVPMLNVGKKLTREEKIAEPPLRLDGSVVSKSFLMGKDENNYTRW